MDNQDTRALDADHHHIRGHRIYDERGQHIGIVDDVVYDDRTGEPKYIVVHPEGWVHDLLHDDHYVPAHRSHWESDRLVTPFDKDTVLHAPTAFYHRHIVDPSTERAIDRHYRVPASQG